MNVQYAWMGLLTVVVAFFWCMRTAAAPRCTFLLATLVVSACNPTPKSSITNDGPTTTSVGSTPATAEGTSVASPSGSGDKKHVKVAEATQDTDALSLIRTKRLEAKADNRVLVVYVSATWCEPCKKFKAEIESGRLDERLGSVTLLAFDADKDIDRLGSAGYTFKFVPFVALPGVDGHPSDQVEATGKGNQAWRELLGKLDSWQAQR